MIRIIGIDPGSTELGFAVFDVNRDDKIVSIITIPIDLRVSMYYDTNNLKNRMFILEKLIRSLFKEYQPDYLAIEDNYIDLKKLSAVKSLITSVTIITNVWEECMSRGNVRTLSPSLVKKNIGVKGNSGDKEDMIRGLKKIKDIRKHIDFSTLTQHEVDAIAIGYYLIKS